MTIPKPNKRPPMPMVIPPRTNGKTYCQLRILLDEYKNGIWTAEEEAELIFKLFRRKQDEVL
jgi:hypothetical protein